MARLPERLKLKRCRCRAILISLMLMSSMCYVKVWANQVQPAIKNLTKKTKTRDKEPPITFQAEVLEGSRDTGQLHLSGKVVVEKENITLRAHNVTIYYSTEKDNIQRIKASGDAKIDNFDIETKVVTTLTGESIEYDVFRKKIVAQKNVVVSRENDKFFCSKAFYFLEDGKINAMNVNGALSYSELKKK